MCFRCFRRKKPAQENANLPPPPPLPEFVITAPSDAATAVAASSSSHTHAQTQQDAQPPVKEVAPPSEAAAVETEAPAEAPAPDIPMATMTNPEQVQVKFHVPYELAYIQPQVVANLDEDDDKSDLDQYRPPGEKISVDTPVPVQATSDSQKENHFTSSIKPVELIAPMVHDPVVGAGLLASEGTAEGGGGAGHLQTQSQGPPKMQQIGLLKPAGIMAKTGSKDGLNRAARKKKTVSFVSPVVSTDGSTATDDGEEEGEEEEEDDDDIEGSDSESEQMHSPPLRPSEKTTTTTTTNSLLSVIPQVSASSASSEGGPHIIREEDLFTDQTSPSVQSPAPGASGEGFDQQSHPSGDSTGEHSSVISDSIETVSDEAEESANAHAHAAAAAPVVEQRKASLDSNSAAGVPASSSGEADKGKSLTRLEELREMRRLNMLHMSRMLQTGQADRYLR